MRTRLLVLVMLLAGSAAGGCNWKKSTNQPGTNLDALDRHSRPGPGQPPA